MLYEVITPRSTGYLADAHALGFQNLTRIICQDLYFIEGQLSQNDLQPDHISAPAVLLLVVGGKQNLMNLLIIAWGDPVVALGAIFILSATVRVILYLYGLLPVKYMIQPSLRELSMKLISAVPRAAPVKDQM